MDRNKTARRCCSNERAKHVRTRDAHIVAREYDEWAHVAGIIIGIAFGVMLFIGILAG